MYEVLQLYMTSKRAGADPGYVKRGGRDPNGGGVADITLKQPKNNQKFICQKGGAAADSNHTWICPWKSAEKWLF